MKRRCFGFKKTFKVKEPFLLRIIGLSSGVLALFISPDGIDFRLLMKPEWLD